MHSSHHTKFQPEWWLPDPVHARIDVFRPDSGLFNRHIYLVQTAYSFFIQPTQLLWLLNSHNVLLWHSNSPCVAATQPVWLPHSLCVASTQRPRARHGHSTEGTGGARKVWRHCWPRLTHTHTHTHKIATSRCGGMKIASDCHLVGLDNPSQQGRP